ncbi:peptide chain release factor N(5)-glutamine methyltransferase [Sneathiella sp. HT1-7]|uniref:peptide chain release factor N(5)-glutamine methyltransferase n=1 Tax=Sneathiella sp. HT1-7 TaxID=2887192 RepID=UPI001D143D4C|nr:peptide chain release factor N(5)-glutamine methyltransferase [Sneathiella sp. HT1-7]MCC3303185.1 peptide chain release factor N(5)-glutamine methyltransferase [Sneathiella sp. HT1-7]
MTASLRSAVLEAGEILRQSDVSDAKRDAALLLANVLGEEVTYLYREPDRVLTDEEHKKFNSLITRRAAREPLSHLTGHREFWSLDFLVNKDVLDPRPDSETLIEAVLSSQNQEFNPRRVLDLGTGSGCLLLTILSEIPSATGVGIDCSDAALAVARKNASRLGLELRTEFHRGSWDIDLGEKFDLVISNPPYIPTRDMAGLQPEVRDFEPHLALDGGVDGLGSYRDILSNIRTLLRPNGQLVFEVGIEQAQQVGQMMQNSGLSLPQFHRDIAAIERCVSAFLRD